MIPLTVLTIHVILEDVRKKGEDTAQQHFPTNII
jgi:hypothetical protein